jgi:hypothetical protein
VHVHEHVHGVRQEVPPRLKSINREIVVDTDGSVWRLDLLHENVRQYGTDFNTVAPCTELSGVPRRKASPLQTTQAVEGITIMVVAGNGIVVNTATALRFMRGRETDLNIRGAYFHMAADALVSAGVVVTGGLAVVCSWAWLDLAGPGGQPTDRSGDRRRHLQPDQAVAAL